MEIKLVLLKKRFNLSREKLDFCVSLLSVCGQMETNGPPLWLDMAELC